MRASYLILLLLFCSGGYSHAQESYYSAESPLRVGVILPLSGDAASVGGTVRNAITMAYESLPEEDRERLKLYFEDDAMESRQSVSAYQRLRAQHNIEALVNVSSGTANALAPLAEQHGIPFIAMATDPAVVEGRKNVFNFWVSPATQTEALFPEVSRRNYKNIARISTIHDFSYAVNTVFDGKNDGLVKVVLDEEYAIDVRDFRTFLSRIRARSDIDAIMPLLFPGQLSSFAVQARQMGVELPLFGYEMFEDANEIKLARGALEGAWYVNADDPEDFFLKRFQAKYPDSSLFGAGNGHDIVLLLAKGSKKARRPAEIVSFLANLKDFSGAMGTYSSSGDNRFTLPAAIKEVRGDGFVTLSR